MTTWDDPDGFPDPYVEYDDEFDEPEPCISPTALCRVKYPFKNLLVDDLVISSKSEGGWTLVYHKNPTDSRQVSEWVPTDYLTEVRPKERKPSTSNGNMGMINTNIIKVTDLPERTTKQEITAYFENKRKHFVGKIISIDLNERGTTAMITFKDNKSVERVMRKLPLKFGETETQIHVEQIPIDDSPTSSDSEDSDEMDSTNRTIEVRNIPETATNESLQIHFMSSKRSGGGEVESCFVFKQEGYAKITFENEEDMNRALQRKQVFEGHELLLKLFEPAPPAECYKNKFFVSGIDTDTDAKMLKLLFRVKAGLRATVTDIHEGEEDGTALVTCDSDVDIPRLKAAFESDTEHRYKIEPVPITCIIEVRNVSPRITEETLKYYFMIEKESGGGDIENIKEHDGVFYIQFEDPMCVERTCDKTRQHKLGGDILQVTAFYDCLHGHGDFTMPKAIPIHDADPAKMEFLKRTQQQMMKELNENFMKLVWPEEDEEDGNSILRIECLIKKTQRGYKKLAKQWEKNAMKVIQSYLDKITVETTDNISSEVWDAVWSDTEHLRGASSDTYIIVQDKTEQQISIVGHKDIVAEVSKQIRKIIREKETEYERKEDDVVKTMNIESFKIELFKALGHIEELKQSFPNLKINVLEKQIDFEGPYSQITEAKLFVHLKLSDIKSAEVGRYSRRFMNFVQMESVRDYLEEKLTSQNITAVLNYDSTKRLMVYSTDDKSAVNAAHVVKEAIVETDSRKVPENSDCLLSSPELKSKIEELNKQFPGLLETSPDFQECSIQIFCVQDNAGSVLEVINEYLTNNILREQARKKPRGILRFLYDHRSNDIKRLQEDLKNHFVDIEIDETAIYIRGTTTGLVRAKLLMEKMIRKIFKKKQVFKNSGIISQIGTAQGYEKIEGVEEATGCIIEIATEDDDEEEQEEEENTSPSPKIWAQCRTPSEKSIFCMHGDITQAENVDVIVNAADGHLKMEGGLAKLIKEKGGKEVVDSCKSYIASKGRMIEGDVYCGPPGDLRNQCKSIFHAVGPIYRDGKQREEDYLREVMFQILEQATSRRYRSIVVPAISTGIYNYPLTEAVKVLVETVAEYFEDNSDSTVSDVYFCDIHFDVVTTFGHQLKETFGSGSVLFSKQENKQGGWLDLSKGREPKAEKPVVSTVFNGTLKVGIVRGNIALQKVDVIVNLTSKELDLEFDPAGLGLLDKGGKDLQRQCQAEYPEGIEENDIALTRGGNLLCKNIFHCCIPQEKTLSDAVNDFTENCLTLAHDERFESIAIPPISTGKFQFSAEEIASGMIACFHKFAQRNPKSTLKDVRVVIPDTSFDEIQIFEERLKEYEASLSRKTDSRQSRTYLSDQQDISKDSDFPRKSLIGRPKPIPRSPRNCYSIQNINLEVNKGDLPSAKADALVYIYLRTSSFEGANLSAFKERAGDDVFAAISAKLSYTSDKKSFPAIKAGDNIPARFIIVVNPNTSGRDMKAILLKAMHTAEERGCESVAVSGFWKSDQRKDLQDAIHKLYDAIVEFQSSDYSFLKSVQIVIQQQSSFTALLPIIKNTVDTRKEKKTGFLSKFTSLFGSNDQQGANRNRNSATGEGVASSNYEMPTQPASVTTIFYGDSKEKIDGAIEELIQRFQSDIKVEMFEDDIIKEFSQHQIGQIQDLYNRHSVEIKIEKRLGRIRVTGMPENVASAADHINKMLRSFANMTYKEREAKQLQQIVQWCYEYEDDEREYDMIVNRDLENAYLHKDRQKKLRFDKGEYIFDFEEMVEYPVNDPRKVLRIIRRDARKPNKAGLGTVEYPDGWKEMTSAQNLITVDLDPTDKEYKQVLKSFNDTVGQSKRTIHKILRIQNKMIYRQYVAKKDQMRKDNKNCRKNERQLWHGTSEGSLTSINRRGLNRSYCGKHATVYGQGIYFAAGVEYSAQDTYSPPTPTTGNKYVYLCNVLTGEFTRGATGMRVPPAKSDTEDCLYDSVVDNEEQPTIFVIFNDTQAYPAYLVTFT